MPSLRYVSLERDGISTLPSIDWQAIYWRSLRLAGNKLTSLPKALVAAPDMQMLDCKDNPLPAPQNRSFHNNTMIREAVLSVR
jgi:Leucine-rich repeat (LRR) protein